MYVMKGNIETHSECLEPNVNIEDFELLLSRTKSF